MTIWDDIYKNYQQNGEEWATISEEVHPLFKQFLSQSSFELKSALDIGCGTGKYLKLLQAAGFKTDGIDSSETAVEMTKGLLGDGSLVQCANMFDFQIPKDRYDLVISISVIHHGTKAQVQDLINAIYEALTEKGKVFITVPDFEKGRREDSWKNDQEIEPGTYAPTTGPEKGLPHSFYTKEEAEKLFSKFKDVKIELDEVGRWVIQASK
jgi:2-polyprenyl-3-methyl-5-hydroxy-6-metoxy-1,4-benzoquinol methylase